MCNYLQRLGVTCTTDTEGLNGKNIYNPSLFLTCRQISIISLEIFVLVS